MASEATLTALITVLDRTQQPLQAISARFAAFSAPLTQLGARLSALAEETGLTNIGEHAARAFDQVKHLGGELLSLAGPLAALGAAGSVAGLVELAKSTGEVEEQLSLSAVASGMAGQQLAGWQYAAKLANVDVEQLTKGFEYLNRNIADAAQGKAKDVEAILSQMGLHNTQGHLVATADALKAVAAEAQHLVASGQVQTADSLMSKLFGERAGMQLLPLFAQGPDQILAKLKEAQASGVAPSNSDIAQGAAFEESFKKMAAAVDGLKFSIANGLFPALTPIIDKMTVWITANRDWLATHIGESITSLATAIADVDWRGLIDGFKETFGWASWLIDKTIGVKGAIIALVAISLAPLILAFSELGFAVASTAAKFIIFPAVTFIASLASLIPAIGSAADAFAAFDLVLDANPIGAIVLAIGLFAAAAYEIYEHWQPIQEFFVGLWDGIAGAFSAAWAKIKPIVEALKEAIDFVANHMPGASVTNTGGQSYVVDPSSGQVVNLGPQTPLTQLPGGGPAGTAGGIAAQSQAKVQITHEFKNAPANMSTQIQTKGNVNYDARLGYAFP